MEYDFAINFYFRDGDINRTVDYSVSPMPAPFEHSLLVFSYHTLRALVNTARGPHAQWLANLLIDRSDLVETFTGDTYY